jgi:thiol-disulfide isomerase/thioredoxin
MSNSDSDIPDLPESEEAAAATAGTANNQTSASGSVEGEKFKRASIPFWGKIIIMSILVFLAALGYLRTHHEHAENVADIQEGPSDVPDQSKRKPVPDILMTASVGPNKRLSDFKGKVVLLSFWASWCTPCLIELPTFIDLYQKLSDKGLVIIPLNVDESDQAADFVGDFWKTKKFPFPTFFDPSHEGSNYFKVDALPSNFVLDKKGLLVAQGYGANDWASDASVRFIESLLKE